MTTIEKVNSGLQILAERKKKKQHILLESVLLFSYTISQT